jgi:transposase
MKKRPYRAAPVKQINIEAIAKATEGRRLVVAVDVGKTKMRAALVNEQRENLGTVGWDHPAGTREFLAMLEQLSKASIEVVMEPSGTYGHALMHLCHARWPVSLVSGKRTHDAAEVFDGVPSSHDGKCAQIIARLHLERASRPWTPDSAERRDLKAATKTMDRYQARYTDGLNELEAELARTWPELLGLLDLTSAALLDLLGEYPDPASVVADKEGASKLLRAGGGHLLSDEKIKAVIASALSSHGVSLSDGERAALRELAKDTRVARHQSKAAKERLRFEAKKSETARNLTPFAGAITAAVLVATVGEMSSFPHVGAFLKNLGLNLRERSSGKTTGRLAITKRGPSRTRKYLYLLALRTIQSNEVVRAWYEKKVLRDGGKKMKAVTAVMRKLAKAIWHVGRGADFEARKLFDIRVLDLPQNVSPEVALSI